MRPEEKVEAYLKKRCVEKGWMCEKFVSPGKFGVPDRLITLPGNRMYLVEAKSEKGKLTAHQKRDHARRKKYGVHVFVVYSKKDVDRVVNTLNFIVKG